MASRMVQISEYVRRASLGIFITASTIGCAMLLGPFLTHAADCGTPGQSPNALNLLQCAGAPYGGKADPNGLITAIANIILFLLGLMGILLTLLLLYGGFMWMTARGDDKQVAKAREVIKQAVVGIVIILSAWSVSYFIVSRLAGVIGGSSQ